MYGRRLGLETGFFAYLAPIVIEKLGHVFPELVKQQDIIHKVILSEEEAFGKTLDRGLRKFEQEVDRLSSDGQPNETLVIPERKPLSSMTPTDFLGFDRITGQAARHEHRHLRIRIRYGSPTPASQSFSEEVGDSRR